MSELSARSFDRAEQNNNMALTKAEMAEALFDQLGLNKREARELVDLFFEELRTALSTGAQVKLSGFGNFDLRDKNQRPVETQELFFQPFNCRYIQMISWFI